MATPPWAAPAVTLIAAAMTLSLSACTGIDEPSTSLGPAAPPPFLVSEDDDEYDCPKEVPKNECVELSTAERTGLWWDVQIGIRWEIESCAEVGHIIQDFVLYGNMRKWPNQRYPYWNGAYRRPSLFRTARVSLNDRLWQQGWATERTRTTMHEGLHHNGNYDEIAAAAFEDQCVNN